MVSKVWCSWTLSLQAGRDILEAPTLQLEGLPCLQAVWLCYVCQAEVQTSQL